MIDDFLQKLLSAKSDDERSWLVTQNLLNSLPGNVQRAVFAAAIPHWFNQEILKTLLPDIAEEIEGIYSRMQSLPFTEPYQGRGSNIHETTRKTVLNYLWENNPALYKLLSRNASEYFSAEFGKNKEKQVRIEQIYHAVIAESEENSQVIWEQGAEWHDEREDYTYSSLNALILSIQEHIQANRVAGIAVGWTLFWDALIASYHYEYEKAKTLFRRVIASNYGNDTLKVNCIQALGDVHNKLSELPEARARYEEALPLYRAIGAKIGEANCIQALGDVHNKLSELPKARARYEEALPLYRAIGEKIGEANCIQALGDVHNKLSELPKARARYEEALPLYRAIGEKIGEANCIQALGDVHNKLSELPEARARYEEALPLYRAIGAKIGEANCIQALGDVHNKLSELPEARARYEEALPLYRAIGAKIGEANCIKALGDVHNKLSELPEARARYEEALPLYRAIGAKIGEANCIQALGDVHNKLSELPEARARYEEALPLYRAIGAKIGEANCIKALGDVHNKLSELPEARARYEEALPLYRAIGAKIGEANCIKALGDVLVQEENYKNAILHYEQAISLYRKINLPASEASVINSIANMYDKQKEYAKAIETYSRALALFPSRAGYVLRNRAYMNIKIKHVIQAKDDLDSAEKLQPENAYLFLRQGELAILTGEFDKAFKYFNTALERYPRMNYAFFGIGMAHLRMNHLEQALTAYQQGLDVTDSANDLDDAIQELEELKAENVPSVEAVLKLLKGFTPRR